MDQIADICRRHGVARLGLFGSALRDDFGPDSDIDLVVHFEPGRPVGLRLFTVEAELTDALGRKVDLNTPGFLARRIRERVLNEEVPLYVAHWSSQASRWNPGPSEPAPQAGGRYV